MLKGVKVAVTYDWIDKWGGVERVLLTLHEMFPQAEFFTSYYDPEKATWAHDLKIRTSFIQKFPSFIRENRLVSLPFYPYAFESFDFTGFHAKRGNNPAKPGYDLVISVTSSFAKSIITKPGTLHICYLLTPTRYLWFLQDEYFKNKALMFLLSPYLARLRKWDFLTGQRPDNIISISQTVADRCRKYYRRESAVIYPPFDIEYWHKIKDQISKIKDTNQNSKLLKDKKFFLIVSRLESYKKVDLAVETFNSLRNIPLLIDRHQYGKTDSKYSLVVIGEGSQLKGLQQMAGEDVVFFNRITDQDLGYLYSNAEALIMPQEEDFGYVALEAQFFGAPVIAFNKGGATETVIEGKTGIFFAEQTPESLKRVLRRFSMVKYRLKRSTQEFGQKDIEKFSKSKFIEYFRAFLISKIKDQKSK